MTAVVTATCYCVSMPTHPQVPFYALGEQPLFDAIVHDTPDFSWPPRPHASASGSGAAPQHDPAVIALYAAAPEPSAAVVALLQWVLTKDPRHRPTLRDIAGHPWLSQESEMDGWEELV